MISLNQVRPRFLSTNNVAYHISEMQASTMFFTRPIPKVGPCRPTSTSQSPHCHYYTFPVTHLMAIRLTYQPWPNAHSRVCTGNPPTGPMAVDERNFSCSEVYIVWFAKYKQIRMWEVVSVPVQASGEEKLNCVSVDPRAVVLEG